MKNVISVVFVVVIVAALGSVASGAITFTGDVSPSNPAAWTSSITGYVGKTTAGSLNVTGDSDVRSYRGYIGYNVDSSGEVTVAGAGSTWSNSRELTIADTGSSGTLNIMNGGAVDNTEGVIGHVAFYNQGSTGTVNVDGANSTWTNRSSLTVGDNDKCSGTLNITNGGAVTNTYGHVGDASGSTGKVTVDGTNSTWTNAYTLHIADRGNGKLSVTGGGVVSNGFGSIGYSSTGVGKVLVDGSGSKWTNSSGILIGSSGQGTLAISNGGLVTVGSNASINDHSMLAIDVSNNSMLTIGGDFTNNGIVRLTAGTDLAVGTYTPIVADYWNTWDTRGTYESMGGKWSESAHTFTVAAAVETVSGGQVSFNLNNQQRVNVGDNLSLNFMPNYTNLVLTATETNAQVRGDLAFLLDTGETIQDSWDFDISGLVEGDDVRLSFASSGAMGSDDVKIWHYDDTNGWTQYDATDLLVAGGWVSFSVDSFSSYAITSTSIPEPATLGMLALGGLALLRRRRKQ